MPTRLLLEGPDIEELLQRVRTEHGPGARIVQADKVRTGGVAGFFAKEKYEVEIEIDTDETDQTDAPATLTSSDDPFLELARQADADEVTFSTSSSVRGPGGSSAMPAPRKPMDEPSAVPTGEYSRNVSSWAPQERTAPAGLPPVSAGSEPPFPAPRGTSVGGSLKAGLVEDAVPDAPPAPAAESAPAAEEPGSSSRFAEVLARLAAAGVGDAGDRAFRPVPGVAVPESVAPQPEAPQPAAIVSTPSTPPVEAPPVQAPPVEAPPVQAPVVEAPVAPVAEAPRIEPVPPASSQPQPVIDDLELPEPNAVSVMRGDMPAPYVSTAPTYDVAAAEPADESWLPAALPDDVREYFDPVHEESAPAPEESYPGPEESSVTAHPHEFDFFGLQDQAADAHVAPASAAVAALSTALSALPAPPKPPTEAGDVFVIVGDAARAYEAATELAETVGQDPRSVVLVAPTRAGTGVPPSRHATEVSATREHVQRLRRTGAPAGLAVDAPFGSRGSAWAREHLHACNATVIWGVVDATRKTGDLEDHLGQLGGVDALIVENASMTRDPGAILNLGVPVAVLDGRRATRSAWTAAISARLFGDDE